MMKHRLATTTGRGATAATPLAPLAPRRRAAARVARGFAALRRAALGLAAGTFVFAAAAPTIDAATPPAATGSGAGAPPAIVVLGDSLSAEYGLPRDTGWVALLRERLARERLDYSVANASISGDTTSGGLARLPLLMQRLKPAIVIVELGGNDALRGVPLATTESNLRAIVAQVRQGHARPLLIGMYVPPNYGPDYTQHFHELYVRLAKELRVPLVPFLLAGMGDKPELFQSDQIHPTRQAQPLLLDNVWPTLKPLLGSGG